MMRVQSTLEVSREEAESKWVEDQLEKRREELQVLVQGYDDKSLEDAIESDFYNYNIVDFEARNLDV